MIRSPALLVGLALSAALALATASCLGGGPDLVATAEAAATATATALHEEHHETEPTATARAEFAAMTPLVVNVYLTDAAMSPSILSVPAGRPVLVVVRSRATHQHTFEVSGLSLLDDVWFVRRSGTTDPSEEPVEVGASRVEAHVVETSEAVVQPTVDPLDAHEAHHKLGEMATQSTSLITAEVQPAELVMLMFTATTVGDFPITDPTDPALTGRLIVF